MRLHGARILFVVGIAVGLFLNLVQAASAPELAVYRGTEERHAENIWLEDQGFYFPRKTNLLVSGNASQLPSNDQGNRLA
jgi:hypothetical protein